MTGPKRCSEPACTRTSLSRGLCKACYVRYRSRQTAYGRFESMYVDAEPARSHVRTLREAGLGTRRIAELACVNRKTVVTLLHGRADRGSGPSKTLLRASSDAILAVPLPILAWKVVGSNTLVDAIGSQRRIHALIANGWSVRELANHTSLQGSTLHRLVLADEGEHRVTARVARDVAELFGRLQLVPAPCIRSKNRAARAGWALPFQWDEESIDDPSATPCDERWNVRSSQREVAEQVAALTEKGYPARRIAAELKITPRTVVRYRTAVPA